MRRRLRVSRAILAALLLTLVLPGSASAARGLELGLTDSVYTAGDAATRQLWLDRTVDARAGLVLLSASWGGIAPDPRPAGFDPTDPNDPAYSWATLDAAVQDATARGLRVAIIVGHAPSWAEGQNRPSLEEAPAGTWRPDPVAVGQFATAIATRYSGSFSPAGLPGSVLPPVRVWQLWAEPNLSNYLTPQFEGHQPASPDHYRQMLNAFYGSVKGVSSDNFVLTGGTAPYGDPPGGRRMQPVTFWRELFCFKGKHLRGTKCPDPAQLDAISHHPINVGSPRRKALSPDDASTPDLGKIARILHKAERRGRVLPKGEKSFWATEIWWDSNPPDPEGVPEAQHARWLAESLYLLWRQGVDTAIWFQIRDAAPEPSFGATPQTGLFLQDGTPKLAYEAFRFPFVGDRTGKRKVRVWGKAPAPGPVWIQRSRGGEWHDLKQIEVPVSRVFQTSIALRGKAMLRARTDSEASLAWLQK